MVSDQNKKPSASVVIRCYNEEKYIGRLLHGIVQQTIKDIEIIIVDSGSTDATLDIASRYTTKIYFIKPDNFSFGHSLNIGCSNAKKDLIVLASAHVYPVCKDWLEQLLSPFKDPLIGLVYGKQRGEETTKCSEHQIFEKWFPDRSDLNQSHPFCNNANAAIRKSLWEEFHYNEELTGLEDIDLANRILKAGYKIAYQSNAIIVHIHNEMPRQIYNRYRREAIALKRIFPDEHFDFSDFIRLFVHNTVNDYYYAIKNGFGTRIFFEIPLFRLMQFLGTYYGFKESGSVTSQLKQTFYYPNRNRHKPPLKRSKKNYPQLIDYQTEERIYRENH